jgi:hypothetical protein
MPSEGCPHGLCPGSQAEPCYLATTRKIVRT